MQTKVDSVMKSTEVVYFKKTLFLLFYSLIEIILYYCMIFAHTLNIVSTISERDGEVIITILPCYTNSPLS